MRCSALAAVLLLSSFCVANEPEQVDPPAAEGGPWISHIGWAGNWSDVGDADIQLSNAEAMDVCIDRANADDEVFVYLNGVLAEAAPPVVLEENGQQIVTVMPPRNGVSYRVTAKVVREGKVSNLRCLAFVRFNQAYIAPPCISYVRSGDNPPTLVQPNGEVRVDCSTFEIKISGDLNPHATYIAYVLLNDEVVGEHTICDDRPIIATNRELPPGMYRLQVRLTNLANQQTLVSPLPSEPVRLLYQPVYLRNMARAQEDTTEH